MVNQCSRTIAPAELFRAAVKAVLRNWRAVLPVLLLWVLLGILMPNRERSNAQPADELLGWAWFMCAKLLSIYLCAGLYGLLWNDLSGQGGETELLAQSNRYVVKLLKTWLRLMALCFASSIVSCVGLALLLAVAGMDMPGRLTWEIAVTVAFWLFSLVTIYVVPCLYVRESLHPVRHGLGLFARHLPQTRSLLTIWGAYVCWALFSFALSLEPARPVFAEAARAAALVPVGLLLDLVLFLMAAQLVWAVEPGKENAISKLQLPHSKEELESLAPWRAEVKTPGRLRFWHFVTVFLLVVIGLLLILRLLRSRG